jgi:hypothetical protein
MARFIKGAVVLGAMIAMIAGLCLAAQQTTKRLILKDGSYQVTTKWEIHGDRVRYFSAERYTWEEVPTTFVDWPATEKYNNEHQGPNGTPTVEEKKEEKKDDSKHEPPEEPDPTLVAPGLHLPDGGGVFLLDIFRDQPQLVELAQNGSELNRHTGRNILRAAINPVALSSKQTIELKSARAKVQAHVAQPAIYIQVDPGSGFTPPAPAKTQSKSDAPAPPRYRIIRLEKDKKKDLRVVGNLNVAIYGKVSQKETWIKTSATPVGEWVKVVPDQALEWGEYAVVELLDKGQINLFVWDFGVDPTAPANPNAWTPRSPAPGEASGQPPGLTKRPK